MSPFRSAIMASASGDEIIITTGVIVSTIHCLMLPISLKSQPGPLKPLSRTNGRGAALLPQAIRVSKVLRHAPTHLPPSHT